MPKRRNESSDHDTDRHSDSGNDKSSSGNKQSSKHARSDADGSDDDETGSRNSNAIPIFLKKTYRMIETCDPSICSWTKDGEMFVVKNPDEFAAEIIPQYFDHNKFSSFARQLNFYGFRKIQTKPIRNKDFDKSTSKHVTFFNDKFKRGRNDLLRDIQRSTRGGGAQASLADQAREVETLHSAVFTLEGRVQELESRWRELTMKMEREIQSKVEYAVMDLLSSMQSATQHPPSSSAAAALQAQYMGMSSLSHPSVFQDGSMLGLTPLQRAERSFGGGGSFGARNPQLGGTPWVDALLGSGSQVARASSVASIKAEETTTATNPTLPPHPKQKSLPPSQQNMSGLTQGSLHQNMQAGGGLGSLSSASNSSMLLRNAWEDKFFSTLMMQDGANRAASLAGLAAHGMGGPAGMGGNGGGMGMGSVGGPSLAALAAVQHMHQKQQQSQHHLMSGHQQQQAAVEQAFMQQQQREVNRMIGIADASMSDSFKQQTTSDRNSQGGEVDKGRDNGAEVVI